MESCRLEPERKSAVEETAMCNIHAETVVSQKFIDNAVIST